MECAPSSGDAPRHEAGQARQHRRGGEHEQDQHDIVFKEYFAKDSTDLSKVTLKYTAGNTYYIEDAENNKMKTQTIKGFFNDSKSSSVTPPADKEANKTALTTAIADAKTAKDALTDEAKKAELQTAIEAAEKVNADKKATQAQVDAAKADLDAAVKKAQETGDVKVKTVAELGSAIKTSNPAPGKLTVVFLEKDLPADFKSETGKYTLTFKGEELAFTDKMGAKSVTFDYNEKEDKATLDASKVTAK